MTSNQRESIGGSRTVARWRSVLIAVAVLSSLAVSSSAAAPNSGSPVGKWTTVDDVSGKPTSVVEIWEEQGTLRGKITATHAGAE